MNTINNTIENPFDGLSPSYQIIDDKIYYETYIHNKVVEVVKPKRVRTKVQFKYHNIYRRLNTMAKKYVNSVLENIETPSYVLTDFKECLHDYNNIELYKNTSDTVIFRKRYPYLRLLYYRISSFKFSGNVNFEEVLQLAFTLEIIDGKDRKCLQ